MKRKFLKKNLKNKHIFVIILVALILLALFSIIVSSIPKIQKENNTGLETNQQIITGKNETEKIPEIKSNAINKDSKLENFYGKPSLIVFAGTYCSHCNALIPEIEKEIWYRYNKEVNIWVNVTDGSTGKLFKVKDIAQGYNPNLSYNEIIGSCTFVPAYVVLDKEGNTVLRSCGSEKTITNIKEAIDKELKEE